MVDQQHLQAALAGDAGAEQAGGAGADDRDIEMLGKRLEQAAIVAALARRCSGVPANLPRIASGNVPLAASAGGTAHHVADDDDRRAGQAGRRERLRQLRPAW